MRQNFKKVQKESDLNSKVSKSQIGLTMDEIQKRKMMRFGNNELIII